MAVLEWRPHQGHHLATNMLLKIGKYFRKNLVQVPFVVRQSGGNSLY